jgi:hypothetical protein
MKEAIAVHQWLYTGTMQQSGFFLNRGRQRQVFVAGVEVNATFDRSGKYICIGEPLW